MRDRERGMARWSAAFRAAPAKSKSLFRENNPRGGSPKNLTDIPLGLRCKLVSIIVHVDEGGAADGTEGGHPFDWVAIRSLLADPEVRTWVAEMTRLGFAPVKRNPADSPRARAWREHDQRVAKARRGR